ncbi:MAG TPA: nucleoside deaminase [Candidatus Limnocylindria bacterium]|nr:nucleoside deaminase [Candidatus Limnocylindria bacterium]
MYADCGFDLHIVARREFMQIAIDEALAAVEFGEHPIGAVVVQGGDRIVGQSGNRVHRDNDPTAHAEIVAIRQAARALGRRSLPDCTLHSTLEPCGMCAGACIHAGISVAFGTFMTEAEQYAQDNPGVKFRSLGISMPDAIEASGTQNIFTLGGLLMPDACRRLFAHMPRK